MRRFLLTVMLLCAVAMSNVSCHHLITDRIPAMPVRITFNDVGMWNTYGIGGALDTRTFIRSERIPVNFPYTALSYTGFGGVLLVGDLYGNPIAYDLACPVECRADVRIRVDKETNVAECPVCHSTYDIFSNYGHPLSGYAAQKGYGLMRYYVGAGIAGEYMVITR